MKKPRRVGPLKKGTLLWELCRQKEALEVQAGSGMHSGRRGAGSHPVVVSPDPPIVYCGALCGTQPLKDDEGLARLPLPTFCSHVRHYYSITALLL